MRIPGFATEEGTARFKARFEAELPHHLRKANGLWVSSIGLGTYLGEPTAAYDALYSESVTRAAELGINVFDSAINYRHQRSERVIAHALTALIAAGHLRRDEVILATKGGFLTFDADEPPDPAAYFHEKLIATGLVQPEDVAAGCHVMSPRYLHHQIELSRRNLGVETIDIYYLHNPETQLSTVSREEFYRRLRAAFEALEKSVAENKIRMYGAATWNAFRQSPNDGEAISLAEVLRIAAEVGGENHHFRALKLPFNFAMPQALVARSQVWRGKPVTVLEIARAYGLLAFASASLMQAHLVQGLPPQIREKFPGLRTDAQCAIQFVRSTPGITCALVGMGRREHVEENLATARVAPFTTEEFIAAFAK
ncbi:MAG: aldo/keto reductase [Acidobacteriia bacterium]|nr:aldo/keto reductase [Terriglobia bacterium]